MSTVTRNLVIGLWLLLCTTQLIGIDYFYFDRELIHQGQYWRFVTAHFVHLNFNHLILNLLGLSLVLLIVDKTWSLWAWLILIISSALIQSICFYYLLTNVSAYVGFSGVIHSLYVAGSVFLLTQSANRKLAIILLSLVTLKLLTENRGQGISVTEQLIGGHVLVEAHLYGVVIGLVFALGYISLKEFGLRK